MIVLESKETGEKVPAFEITTISEVKSSFTVVVLDNSVKLNVSRKHEVNVGDFIIFHIDRREFIGRKVVEDRFYIVE